MATKPDRLLCRVFVSFFFLLDRAQRSIAFASVIRIVIIIIIIISFLLLIVVIIMIKHMPCLVVLSAYWAMKGNST